MDIHKLRREHCDNHKLINIRINVLYISNVSRFVRIEWNICTIWTVPFKNLPKFEKYPFEKHNPEQFRRTFTSNRVVLFNFQAI